MVDIQRVNFLGGSVYRISSQAGWADSSLLTLSIVEDDRYDDGAGNISAQTFLPMQPGYESSYVGQPGYFEYGSLRFGGVIQNIQESNSEGGKPVFTVSLTDPRPILENVQVIIDSLYLTNSNFSQLKAEFPNILNVFDYWDSTVFFGYSGTNETGMWWSRIRDGITNILEQYGPLRFNNTAYYIDFSTLPEPPQYYRIGGGASVSLLEIITVLCNDAGFDFLVNLEQRGARNYITFKTVSRTAPPPLGQIKTYIDSKANLPDEQKIVNQYTRGLELRNEVAGAVLSGGIREDMSFIDQSNAQRFYPFFGYDIDGRPISTSDLEDSTQVILNCSAIADITGTTQYPTYLIELRAALWNIDMWMTAVELYNPALAAYLTIKGPVDLEAIADLVGVNSFKPIFTKSTGVSFKSETVKHMYEQWKSISISKVYEWVRGQAEEYYGKKFIVQLPNVDSWIDGETGEVKYSFEVCESGFAFEGTAESAIGLLRDNEFIFQDQIGKMVPFARFNNVFTGDFKEINPQDAVMQDDNNTLFVKIEMEPTIISPLLTQFGQTGVVITLPVPIVEQQLYSVGDVTGMAYLLGLTETQVTEIFGKDVNHIYLPAKIGLPPKPVFPSAVAIPIKLNQVRYGPWKTSPDAPGGKAIFEVDDSLVPWNYGGYNGMDFAATAKIANAATYMKIGEMGSVTEEGIPTRNLGDVLKAGGPNITSIIVDIGDGGVTTQYQMRTYTPRFGAYSLQNAQRLQKIGVNIQQGQKALKDINRQKGLVYDKIGRLKKDFQTLFTYLDRKNQHSPHGGLIGFTDLKTEEGAKTTSVASNTHDETVYQLMGRSAQDYQKFGYMGLEGLYRPYAIDYDADNTYLSRFEDPTASGMLGRNQKDLTPFKRGHDIEIVLYGKDEYQDYVLKGELSGIPSGLKPVGLKGPLVLTGWGYNTNGYPVPNSGAYPDYKDSFKDGYLGKPDLWKTGPIDIRWSDKRKVWSGGSFVTKVLLKETLSETNEARANILVYRDGTYEESTEEVKVVSALRGISIASESRALCYYDEDRGKLTVISAEC